MTCFDRSERSRSVLTPSLTLSPLRRWCISWPLVAQTSQYPSSCYHTSINIAFLLCAGAMVAGRWRLVNKPLVLLGDPRHGLARCSWTKTEIRRATDRNGYTFGEFEEWYDPGTFGEFEEEWGITKVTWCWNQSPALNGNDRYSDMNRRDKRALHTALRKILRDQVEFLMGRKVLTHPMVARALPDDILKIIATFFTTDRVNVAMMTDLGCNVKRRCRILNKSLGSTVVMDQRVAR